ncbi:MULTISPECIES: hypothetical protein [Chromobacterium]|uniref:hypothetical protein n=1 Tax=Chromobacterium TaxID=535 RepID=UPI0018885791|nr:MULTISPECIES: hypothetical protein [Chromobacterium]WON84386.1 hypothetical protein OK026_02380 [Chromobacterium haemolyticum]
MGMTGSFTYVWDFKTAGAASSRAIANKASAPASTGAAAQAKKPCAEPAVESSRAPVIEPMMEPAQPVRHRTEGEIAYQHAKQAGSESRSQLIAGNTPLANQLRRDVTDGGGVETVQQHDEKTQRQHHDLIAGQRAIVDELADIHRLVLHGRLL